MAVGGGPLNTLDDLRAPIASVLDAFQQQMAELQRYKARYGSMEQIEEIEGSDTEQE